MKYWYNTSTAHLIMYLLKTWYKTFIKFIKKKTQIFICKFFKFDFVAFMIKTLQTCIGYLKVC